MSHDRTDTIRLPPDVSRCEPSGSCVVRGTVLCAGYLNSHQYRNLPIPIARPRHFGPLE